MHVDKIILRAACTTLAAILTLFAFMALALCFVFPSTVMNFAYDLGMNSVAVKYANRAYERSGDIAYAAFATEVAILDGNAEQIAIYGNLFIADDEFQTYCNGRNENKPDGAEGKYEQYIYGRVYSAEYATITAQEDKAILIGKAFASLDDTFSQGNAVIMLIIAARKTDDTGTLGAIREQMNGVAKDELNSEDRQRFEDVLSLLNG